MPKKKHGDVRVFEFAVTLPSRRNPLHEAGIPGADLLEELERPKEGEHGDLFRRRFNYRKAAVDIELYRREALAENLRKHAPEYVEAEAQVAELEEQIELRRNEIRTRSQQVRERVHDKKLTDEIKELNTSLREATKKLNKIKTQHKLGSKLNALNAEIEETWVKNPNEADQIAKRAKLVIDRDATLEQLESLPVKRQRVVRKIADGDTKIGEEVRDRYKALRNERKELHWGPKNEVAASLQGGRRNPSVNHGKYDGTGTLVFQSKGYKVKKKLFQYTVADMLSGKPYNVFYLEHVPPEQVVTTSKEGRPLWRKLKGKNLTRREIRRQRRSQKEQGIRRGAPVTIRHGKEVNNHWILHLRVTEENDYVSLPFIMHSPERMPLDGEVRYVNVRRRKYHHGHRYYVQFVVRKPGGYEIETGTHSAGIHIGWKMINGVMRIGTCVGSDGHEEEILIHQKVLRLFESGQDYQAAMSNEFNKIREKLVAWINANRKIVSAWLYEETKTLSHWRSGKRLAELVFQWQKPEHRFAGDDGIMEEMLAWSRHNRKLWHNAQGRPQKAIRARNDFFRKTVARLRKQYGTIHLESIKLDELKKNAKAEEEGDAQDVQRLMGWAAPGKFRELLKSSGMDVKEHKTETISLACPRCGFPYPAFNKRAYETTCEGCGEKYDHGWHKAMNLLSKPPRYANGKATQES